MKQGASSSSEFRVRARSLFWIIPVFFLVAGVFFWVYINYLFPYLASVPGFRGLMPRFPVVVERTEQVYINQNINVQTIYDRLKPLTVSILPAPSGVKPSLGALEHAAFSAGLLVTSDGYIFTSKEIFSSPQDFAWVLSSTGDFFQASIIAFDPRSDLAVIKIPAENLPVAQFGGANSLVRGENLVAAAAVGYNAQSSSITVSAVSLPTAYPATKSTFSSDELAEYLTVAPEISKAGGFLGAPLANRSGEIVGLSTSQGIIPGEYLDSSLKFFLKNRTLLRKPLGVLYLPVSKGVAAFLDLSRDSGVLVVAAGGLAAKAGLREGDLIYKINGKDITQTDTFEKIISSLDSSGKMEINYLRNTVEMTAVINY